MRPDEHRSGSASTGRLPVRRPLAPRLMQLLLPFSLNMGGRAGKASHANEGPRWHDRARVSAPRRTGRVDHDRGREPTIRVRVPRNDEAASGDDLTSSRIKNYKRMKERRVLAAPSVFARLSWSPWSFTDRGFLANESVARVTGDTRSRTQRHMRLDVRDGVVNTSTVPASLSDMSISNSSSNAIGDLKASRESCAKAVTEQSLWLEFVFVHAQMWHDDALHVVNDGHASLQTAGGHWYSQSRGPAWNETSDRERPL